MNINMDSTPSETKTWQTYKLYKYPWCKYSPPCPLKKKNMSISGYEMSLPKATTMTLTMLGLRLKTLTLSACSGTPQSWRISCIYLPAKEMTFASRHTYQANYGSITSCFAFRFCEKEDKSFECWHFLKQLKLLKLWNPRLDSGSLQVSPCSSSIDWFFLGFRTIDSSPSHHFRSRLLASEIPLGPRSETSGKLLKQWYLQERNIASKCMTKIAAQRSCLKWNDRKQHRIKHVQYTMHAISMLASFGFVVAQKAISCHLHSFAALRSVEPYAVHILCRLSVQNNSHSNPNQFHPLAPPGLSPWILSSGLAMLDESKSIRSHPSNPLLTDHNRTSWNLQPCDAEELRLETPWYGKSDPFCPSKNAVWITMCRTAALEGIVASGALTLGLSTKSSTFSTISHRSLHRSSRNKSAMAKDWLSMVKLSKVACMREYLKWRYVCIVQWQYILITHIHALSYRYSTTMIQHTQQLVFKS